MKEWVRFFEWLILIGLVVLVVVVVRFWQPEPLQIAVATVPPTATRATTTPTAIPTWTNTPTPTATAISSPTATRTPLPTVTPTVTPTPPPLSLPPHEPIYEADGPNTTLPITLTGGGGVRIVTDTVAMPLIEQPPGTLNILVAGSDRRPGEEVARTDVLMIVSIFPDLPGVSMISIPRDFYAWIPTWGYDKINTAYLRAGRTHYPGGGPALLAATIEYNFGLPIHYYTLVDFNGFRNIVDALGGVDVVVECPFHDTYPDDESPIGQTDIDLEPGVHHLDGKFALWYTRSRWNTSDFDRHRRQQQVLRALFHQALSQNLLPRVPELWGAYRDWVETDLELPQLLSLASVAARLDVRDVKSRYIRGYDLIQSWTAPNGGYVLVPNRENLHDFMVEAAQPPVTSRAAQRPPVVEVWNGNGNSGWGHVAAYRLGLEGFEVVAVEPTQGTARTTVIDFTTSPKGSAIPTLMRLYQLQPGDVVAQPTEGSAVDFRVILGWNYNPCEGTGTAFWHPTPTPTVSPPP